MVVYRFNIYTLQGALFGPSHLVRASATLFSPEYARHLSNDGPYPIPDYVWMSVTLVFRARLDR